MKLGVASEPMVSAGGKSAEAPRSFDWPLAHEAEQLLRTRLRSFLEQNRFARDLSQRMEKETATDFFEWVDHLVLPGGVEPELQSAGFTLRGDLETPHGESVYECPRATLPRVLIAQRGEAVVVAVRPELISDFIARQNLDVEPEGEPFSRYRRAVMAEENGTGLVAIERNGYLGFVTAPLRTDELSKICEAKELWASRPRRFTDDADGFKIADELCDRVLHLVGCDLACQLFFESERVYWESRNLAAHTQKSRQDRLGLGWGNHDHHTFRCSRAHFRELIGFLRKLGFVRRERYYAGAEAGWGAQILEQPVARIVVFADVDLMPEEIDVDFSTTPLPVASRLGTVGLWVALHGESFLDAGMHHLEARFNFDSLRHQLELCGINTMKPFSDFTFLRQAFTEGERWPVDRGRLENLIAKRLITKDQFDQFLEHGAVGSHLENLQRHGGFKGFNQKSVSAIIAATDPRKH